MHCLLRRQIWRSSSSSRCNLVDFGPTSVEIAQDQADSNPNLADVGPNNLIELVPRLSGVRAQSKPTWPGTPTSDDGGGRAASPGQRRTRAARKLDGTEAHASSTTLRRVGADKTPTDAHGRRDQ